MLQPDLIQNLNLIAAEGWEYHKLPPETLIHPGSGAGSWADKSSTGRSASAYQQKMRSPAGSSLTAKASR